MLLVNAVYHRHATWLRCSLAVATVLLASAFEAFLLFAWQGLGWFWLSANVLPVLTAAASLVLWIFRRGRPLAAQPGASPNGGPATPVGNSGVAEGPPSVS
jgi:hypothetical protein